MFTLKKPTSVIWPCEYHKPVDGGQNEKCTFDLEFKFLTSDEVAAINGTDVESARKVVIGWKGVCDENEKVIPFSQKALDEMLSIPMMGSCIMMAFNKMLRGALAGN